MSKFVLLDSEGKVQTKLHFVVVPNDYVIPAGMTLSWKANVEISTAVLLQRGIGRSPNEAYFHFGSAHGVIRKTNLRFVDLAEPYWVQPLEIIVQGTSPSDVMQLRNMIMNIVNERHSWYTDNDLDHKPKPSIMSRLARFFNL